MVVHLLLGPLLGYQTVPLLPPSEQQLPSDSLFSSLPHCTFPPCGWAHATTAWHRTASLAKNHRPATACANKPPHVWQTLRDFPSDVSSAQLPCEHQKVQPILRAWGSLLGAKAFLAETPF